MYRGKQFPELTGAYVFGDFGTGRIWAAKHDGSKLEWTRELLDTPLAITHVSADAAGELPIADYGSPVYGAGRERRHLSPRTCARAGDPAAGVPAPAQPDGTFLRRAKTRALPACSATKSTRPTAANTGLAVADVRLHCDAFSPVHAVEDECFLPLGQGAPSGLTTPSTEKGGVWLNAWRRAPGAAIEVARIPP